MFCEQQIIKMAVTHTEYVCDHTVPSYIKRKGGGGGEEVKEEEEEEESKTTSLSAV